MTGARIASTQKVVKSDEEWRRALTPEQYRITRERQDEPAFRNEYNRNTRDGVYQCVCCGEELFSSDAKFEAGAGWPCFMHPITPTAVETHMVLAGIALQQYVFCARCDAYLGRVHADGPKPLELRYCVNSGAMGFVERAQG